MPTGRFFEQYKNMLKKKHAQKLVILLGSVSIVGGHKCAYTHIILGLKRIYQIFVFEFDSGFVRKYIEIRNIKIPEVKNSFQFLQIANNKWIPSVIYRPIRLTISH